MNPNNLLDKSNLKLAIHYPNLALAFLKGGRLLVYKKAIEILIERLARIPLKQVSISLQENLSKRHINFPESLKLFDTKRLRIGILLYEMIRVYRPELVVETGVCLGKSSSFILAGLRDNGLGRLFSIDLGLPNFQCTNEKGLIQKDTTQGKEVGWLIPDELRDRWTLILGSSRDKLLPLLQQLKVIDVFLHDSEHSYDNMMYEFRAVWPYLKEGGFLISDDVHYSDAFSHFALSIKQEPIIIEGEIGILIKL